MRGLSKKSEEKKFNHQNRSPRLKNIGDRIKPGRVIPLEKKYQNVLSKPYFTLKELELLKSDLEISS
jgi:hypothetical protein